MSTTRNDSLIAFSCQSNVFFVLLKEEHVLPAKVSETVSRSCGDRVFLNLPALQRRIASIGEQHCPIR